MKTCATCGKSKKETSFREDARFKDGRSSICEGCRHDKDLSDTDALTTILAGVEDRDKLALIARVFGALPTVDIEGVPILAAGGPYFGTGSPPEGDFFSKADLDLIAEQTNKLAQAGELRPPSKLGHSEEQRLLNNSGLPVADELPAAGWLENFRVEKLGGIWKLLADVRQVPAKLGQILSSGGYRTRSVELSKVTSQMDGTTYDGVVTGLAWLGAKTPAVRTLDDVWNLYADRAAVTVALATGDVVWEEEDGVMDLLSDLTAAINAEIAPDEPSYMWELWVNDINLKLNKCTASDWDSDTTWIIGFRVGADNEPTVDARDKWTPSTMKLVEIDAETADTLGGGGTMPSDDGDYSARSRYAEMRREARAKFLARTADTKSGMKLTDQQIADYGKAFSIDGDGDELRTKVEAKLDELGLAPAADEPTPTPVPAPAATGGDTVTLASFSEEQRTELESVIGPLRERAERGDRAYADQFARTRDSAITRAMSEGRLNPADREQWVTFYDAQPELALKQLQTLPVNPVLLLTFGTDESGLTTEQREKASSVTEDAWLAATGAEDPTAGRQAA